MKEIKKTGTDIKFKGYLSQSDAEFWGGRLSKVSQLTLPFSYVYPLYKESKKSSIRIKLDRKIFAKLKKTVELFNTRMDLFTLTVYSVLLYRYSLQDNISIYQNSVRGRDDDKDNLRVNKSLNIFQLENETSFSDALSHVTHESELVSQHLAVPFDVVLDFFFDNQTSYPERLFQILFDYCDSKNENEASSFSAKRADLSCKLSNPTHFDLKLMIVEHIDDLELDVTYPLNRFDEEAILRFINHYTCLLESGIDNPNESIGTLKILPAHEREQILNVFNNSDKDYFKDDSAVELFYKQVYQNSNNFAITFNDLTISYRELNERSNQVARYLKKFGIDKNYLVPICIERSIEMIIGIIGVLKSGAAYVPIDTEYPDDRIRIIIDDLKPLVILTSSTSYKEAFALDKTIFLDTDWKYICSESDFDVANNLQSADLAYLIFTSGSTGIPKAAKIHHGGLVNLATSSVAKIALYPGVRVLQFAAFSFDVSVYEILCTLLCGGHIILPSKESLIDPKSLGKILDYHKVEVIALPPSFQFIIEENVYFLKTIFSAGEMLNPKISSELQKKGVKLINAYGPAECSVNATMSDSPILSSGHISIGKPIDNTHIYILDEEMELVPIGVIGEMYIGGASVGLGYLNKPELTAERFIPNPFRSETEILSGTYDRIYKTGDLCRWLPDGNIEYIGRNDFQVKIRGFRIELGEIEAALLACQGVSQCVVMAREYPASNTQATSKYLAAYYVAENRLDEKAIMAALADALPDYMVPAILVHLQKLPLNINGKLDRKALPEPQFSGEPDTYVAPRTELESRICMVYAEVLGIPAENVGIQDDFFRLGGNSIMAIKLVSRLNRALELNINVALIFKHRSIASLTHVILQPVNEHIMITPVFAADGHYPLSFAQERLWFIEKYEGGSNVYNIPLFFSIKSQTDIAALEKSIIAVVQRHEVLRSLIRLDHEGNGYQQVLELSEYPLTISHKKTSGEQQFLLAMKEDANHIFDLEEQYPLRVTFYDLPGDMNYLSLVFHHIAFDGWSVDILLNELNACYHYYQNLVQHTHSTLPLNKLSIQYKDFASWQKTYLSGEQLDHELEFWKQKLAGFETLSLPADKPRPVYLDYRGDYTYFQLDEHTSDQLRMIAKELKVSLYSVLLSAFYLLLKTYSNQDDIVIGTPVANRNYDQITDLIGFFVNSIVLRAKINNEASLAAFIQQVGEEIIQAQLHQDLPFEKLVQDLKLPTDTSRHPVFQVMFNMENFKELNTGQEHFLEYYSAADTYQIARFDLTATLDDSGECLKGAFNYATSLFSEQTMQHMVETYVFLLAQIAGEPDTAIRSLSYLTDNDRRHILSDWNDTGAPYPEEATIHQLFELQARKTPEHTALVYRDLHLSYNSLNERANQMAHYLRGQYDIRPDDLVALCLDRSEYMLISILAVLKAGGAYVPMDPGYPDDRIAYIIGDTRCKVIISELKHAAKVDNAGVPVFCPDELETAHHLETLPLNNPEATAKSNNLAYVIYTSGTTGVPKGVMIEHSGIVNRIKWMNDQYPISHIDRVLQKTPYVFDVSVWELFWANWYGAAIVFAEPDGHKDSEYLTSLIRQEKVSVVHFVPSMLSVFEEHCSLDATIQLNSLRYIFCSGEALGLNLVKQAHLLFPNTQIHNLYGPTEASVDVLYFDCSKQGIDLVAIGKPIANTHAYILDNALKPLPVGAIGELYLSGSGLSRGYLNKPELTAERFIPNPFRSETEILSGTYDRIYKTGDLCRWLPDGNIEYIGRNDFQVKIRGFRIELGEIEAALLACQGVSQCVVMAREYPASNTQATSKYLAAYYVAENRLDEKAIMAALADALPDYMVPAILVHLQKLPLNINGKLDRKALPEPQFSGEPDTYVAPRTELESRICMVYAEVLGIPAENVGIQDDFFRLGGDSIVSIQVVSRLRKHLNLHVSVKDIFAYRTIKLLYDHVMSQGTQPTIEQLSEQGILSGPVDLLPIQNWFFSRNFNLVNHWNQSFIVRVPKLDINILRKSLTILTEYHDALRLRFTPSNDQYYHTDIPADLLNLLDITRLTADQGTHAFDNELQDILTAYQNNFDLVQGPLFTVAYLYEYLDGSARIFFAFHHLIVDTVSWRILKDDLKTVYDQLYLQQLTNPGSLPTATALLGPKGSSYRQWGKALQNYAAGHQAEITYWNEVMKDYDPLLFQNLTDSQSTNVQSASITLEKEVTQQLLTKSALAYHTEINDLLLTALVLACSEITGQPTLHLTLEGHGREEIDEQINVGHTIGWFTSMFPVRLSVDKKDLAVSIKQVKETLRAVPTKGVGFGALNTSQWNILPNILFNYLGQLDNDIRTHGLSTTEWVIINEQSGVGVPLQNVQADAIAINGFILNGQLTFGFYSKLKEIDQFAQLFKNKLTAIIAFTKSLDRSYLTTSDISNIIDQDYLDKIQQSKQISGIYLANSLQQGFIYHWLNQGEIDDAYRVQLIWSYHSKLNVEHLKAAWKYTQAKFPTLRLRFAWEKELIQVIDLEGNLDWRYHDLSDKEDQQQHLIIEDLKRNDRLEEFNLLEGSLFRLALIKYSDAHYVCVFTYHHAILDGWSNHILFAYLHKCYWALENNEKIDTSHIDYSYLSTQKYLQENPKIHLNYWKEYLKRIDDYEVLDGLITPSQKPVELLRYKHILQLSTQNITCKETDYLKLSHTCINYGITLNAVLQYIWHKVLSLYGNTKTTVVGTTVSGRNLPIDDIENSVGLYINTLPIVVEHGNNDLINTIKSLQNDINEANSRSNVALSDLQSGDERLFSSLFIYENYPIPLTDKTLGELGIVFNNVVEKLDYPLSIVALEQQGNLTITLNYAAELFTDEAIKDITKTYVFLLAQIAGEPDTAIRSLSYLTDNDRRHILSDWNDTGAPYPEEATIHQLFELQARKTPEHTALVYRDLHLSYNSLNERANQMAHYLRGQYDIRPDDLVALCLDRSEYMLISILAVLKAGGAYVPMDPGYPDDRIAYIIGDTRCKVIISELKHAAKVDNAGVPVFCPDELETAHHLETLPLNNPEATAKSNNLAYVIYTSGTTGVPKGVMIEHSGIVNTLTGLHSVYGFNKGNKISAFTSYVFDVSVTEFFVSLLNGAELHLLDEQLRTEPDLISRYLLDNRINYTYLPPVLLSALPKMEYPNLQAIVYAGEPCDKVTGLYWSKNTKLFNYYGPTETSVYATGKLVIDGDVSTIGKPIANTHAYILDNALKPLPVGAIGELYLSGSGLSRGYLNKPELTAERFIPNPFRSETEILSGTYDRIYKTGDLCRWLPDGNIEYIGRNDFQVKIRGFRIELGEIEAALLACQGVSQCVVMAREYPASNTQATSKYLAAYYVAENRLDEKAIMAALADALPDYMVPAILVHLQKLPLNINGKLDRKALPEPQFSGEPDTYVAPRTELESRICMVYAEVLGIPAENVGIQDDFFRLGGNSIMAIKLVSRLNRALELNINVALIFKHRSIASLTHVILQPVNEHIMITPVFAADGHYPLSFAQERLWFIEKYEGGSNVYNIPLFFSIKSQTDIAALEKSIIAVVQRHEVLRSLIRLDHEGNGYQQVLELSEYPLTISHKKTSGEQQFLLAMKEDANHIFDLEEQYPLRVTFYDLPGDMNYLSLVFHHIAFDGWSVDILLNELNACYHYYQNLVQHTHSTLPLNKLSIQYKDFASWQKTYLSGEQLDHELEFWKQKLAGFETLSLPADKPRPVYLDYRGDYTYFQLDEHTSDQLRMIAKELKVSLYSVLLSAFYLLLKTYSNQDDIVIGTPVANRNYDQITDLIGFFVNSIVLRAKINNEASLAAFIQQVGEEIIQAQLHQDLPFEKLVQDLKLPTDTSRHPVFQVMFNMENFKELNTGQEHFLEYYSAADTYQIARFDLTATLDDSGECLKGAFNYATSLFSEQTMQHMVETYVFLLAQIAGEPDTAIRSLSYLTDNDRRHILSDWNDTGAPYPEEATIHQLFELQARKTPEHTALVYRDLHLSYNSLNERANQMAHYLRGQYDIRPDDLVALCLDRSEYMLISILAVLKAGGAYVPMDPGYPDDRIAYIIGDTRCKVIISELKHAAKVDNAGVPVFCPDELETAHHLETLPLNNPEATAKSNNLAYVIYTSGTTGVPKGVMIEHNSLNARIVYLTDNYKLTATDNLIFYRSYCFDAAIEEYLLPIIIGAKCFITEPDFKQDLINNILNFTEQNRITKINLPPVVLEELLEVNNNEKILKKLSSLKHVVCGGDKLTVKIVTDYLAKFSPTLYNAYGPTENTNDSTNWKVDKRPTGNHVPIGKPIQNSRAYILDNALKPLPVGAIGELYLSGSGLSRGYLNKPELTAERFIPNPFRSETEILSGTYDRIYKTGDLCRWLPDGNIEYIGRNDFQVKIRGFRIELGEIEAALLACQGVSQCVVMAREYPASNTQATSKYLAAYYVAENRLDEKAIMAALADALPDYMVPAILVHLQKLPLNINGKLDRKALPEPQFSGEPDTYVAPRTELESRICMVYAEVLGIPAENVGIQDDFFRLGGNSIMAIKLVSRLNRALELNINVALIFKHRSIASLTHVILQPVNEHIMITPVFAADGHYPLSFAQERLWFIEKYEGGSNVYNIPLFFSIKSQTDIAALEKSIIAVVQRHEVLRSLIRLDHEGNGYQQVLELSEYPLTISHKKTSGEQQFLLAMKEDANHIFDLEEQYPLRVTFYDLPGDMNYLSLVFHHIAFDGWSVDILLNELNACYHYYQNLVQHTHSTLPLNKLSIQYKDFASWQKTYLSGEQLDHELEFWKQKLAGFETLSLPADKPRPVYLDYRGDYTYFQLDEHTSDQLRMIAKELKVSLYSVLLSAFYLLLKTYSNQDDIVIGTPVANRNYDQITDLIGFFVNSIVLRAKINNEASLAAFIQQVGEEIIQAQLHQDLPFEKLVQDLKLPTDTSRHPVFQVMFNMENFKELNTGQEHFLEYYSAADTYQIARFDLTATLDDSGECLKGAFNYATSLFSEQTMQHMVETYVFLLAQIAGEPDTAIRSLSYLTDNDRRHILSDWNDTGAPYPEEATIHQLFELQARKTPEHTALVYRDLHLSYNSLNERANQMAHYLRGQYDIRPDDLVALCLDRSEYMLISILAVLKAGGAYVPMDPGYPDDRIAYIIGDTRCKVIISELKHAAKVDNAGVPVFCPDELETAHHLETLPLNNPEATAKSNNLAYVIYTSGTTGVPKGVMIEHSGIVNRIKWMNDQYPISHIDRVLQKTPYVFDVSVWELFWANWYGAAIVFAEPDGHKDSEYLTSLIRQEKVSVVHFVPSMLSVFEEHCSLDATIQLNSLRYIFCSGEALGLNLVKQAHLLFPNTQIHNLYGPTEASVDVLYFDCSKQGIDLVAIGKPIANTHAYILDNALKPLPVGAIGELYLSGSGLSRGYLNKPELTAERFIPNPFRSETEILSGTYDRIYKTGDLCRWLPDGNIEYIGRNDFQVKIRGFRIELGEIEAALLACQGVSQCVVMAREYPASNTQATSKYLAAYYVAENRLDEKAIMAALADALPDYMVPAILVHLQKLPLNINGKLDRKALPEPQFSGEPDTYVAPRTELESRICMVYAEVLGIPAENVGIQDNFFRLGGDSIMAIKLVSKLNAMFDQKISVKEIFEKKVISQLCEAVETGIYQINIQNDDYQPFSFLTE